MATAASELAGTSETATYGPPYNNASGVCSASSFAAAPRRSPPADQCSADLRAFPALQARSDRPFPRPRACRYDVLRRQRAHVGRPPTQRGDQGHVRQRARRSSPRQRRSGAGHARHRADAGPSGCARCRSARPAPPSTAPTTPSRCCSWRTAATSPPWPPPTPHRRQWGVMNETGSYPGQPWLWLYRSGTSCPAAQLGQCRPDRDLHHRRRDACCYCPSRSSRACVTFRGGSRCIGSSGGTGTRRRRPGPPARPSPGQSLSPPDRSKRIDGRSPAGHRSGPGACTRARSQATWAGGRGRGGWARSPLSRAGADRTTWPARRRRRRLSRRRPARS